MGKLGKFVLMIGECLGMILEALECLKRVWEWPRVGGRGPVLGRRGPSSKKQVSGSEPCWAPRPLPQRTLGAAAQGARAAALALFSPRLLVLTPGT